MGLVDNMIGSDMKLKLTAVHFFVARHTVIVFCINVSESLMSLAVFSTQILYTYSRVLDTRSISQHAAMKRL